MSPFLKTADLETVKIIMEMEHVIGLKEAPGSIKRMFRLARSMTKPDLYGEDELFFASLCCRAKGGIVASTNLDSEQFVRVYELFRAVKIDDSKQLFHQLLPLVRFLF
ncbi:dihydrodipicolinate synthase family protein [Paenibacillus tyrfis]|uniref:dihydrodipicolinate synthase family protein n=1 Tax=Paenibacillus tyrfis TaxID=1501230 RepID=UPI00248FE057|nr:dihydrodipicolinate synthase family protein [Paenibacillus tyrfis]